MLYNLFIWDNFQFVHFILTHVGILKHRALIINVFLQVKQIYKSFRNAHVHMLVNANP